MFEKADVVMSFKYMFPICIILMYSRYYKIFCLSLFLLHLCGMYFLYHGRFNDVHNRFFGLIDGQLWRVILIVKNMNLTKNANINFAESQDVWKLKTKHNNMHLHTSLCYSSLVNYSIFLITSTIFKNFTLTIIRILILCMKDRNLLYYPK